MTDGWYIFACIWTNLFFNRSLPLEINRMIALHLFLLKSKYEKEKWVDINPKESRNPSSKEACGLDSSSRTRASSKNRRGLALRSKEVSIHEEPSIFFKWLISYSTSWWLPAPQFLLTVFADWREGCKTYIEELESEGSLQEAEKKAGASW